MIRTLLKPLSFLPAIMLMYVIYSFSADTGTVSSGISYKVSSKVVTTANELFDLGYSNDQVSYYTDKIHGPVRKAAHMSEYCALAIAIAFPFYVYGVRGAALLIIAGGICLGFACLDEYHQTFVAGRSGSKRDVAIDSIGIICGIIIVRVVGWTGRMTIFKQRKKKSKRKY